MFWIIPKSHKKPTIWNRHLQISDGNGWNTKNLNLWKVDVPKIPAQPHLAWQACGAETNWANHFCVCDKEDRKDRKNIQKNKDIKDRKALRVMIQTYQAALKILKAFFWMDSYGFPLPSSFWWNLWGVRNLVVVSFLWRAWQRWVTHTVASKEMCLCSILTYSNTFTSMYLCSDYRTWHKQS